MSTNTNNNTPISASGSIPALNTNGAPILSAFGGKIPTPSSTIKQFYDSSPPSTWFYTKTGCSGNGTFILTTVNQSPTLDVVIPGNLIVEGTIITPSDISLKENIQDISQEKINQVLKIDPKLYQFKNDPTKKQHYGVIAQELETLFPELVSSKYLHGTNKKHVDYLELIPLLIGKMKLMQEEINELKEMVRKI
jgi:hypothetical protein